MSALLCPVHKLTFYGWRGNRRPEAFTLLLCQLTPLNLARARGLVQQLLQGQEVTLELPAHLAAQVQAQAQALGIQCYRE